MKLTTYHMGEFRAQLDLIFDVKDRYVKAPYPAWTGVDVGELADPEVLIEIDVVAVASS